MYRPPLNYEMRLFVIHMQGSLWPKLTFVVHIAYIHNAINEKLTVYEWLKKMEQNSFDGSVSARLGIKSSICYF